MNAQWLAGEREAWGGSPASESALAPLAPLVEMNAQCVDLLCALACRQGVLLPPLLAGAPEAWRSLSAGACLRLARVPWLLVDAGFSEGGLWRGLGPSAIRDLAAPLVIAPLSGTPFFGAEARDFFRRVLMFSWHLVQTSPQLARIALGIPPMAAQALAHLRLSELDALAARYPGALRPRWENSPGLWRMLLAAALEEDSNCLAEASLQGIQLMAASCLPPAPAPAPQRAAPTRASAARAASPRPVRRL